MPQMGGFLSMMRAMGRRRTKMEISFLETLAGSAPRDSLNEGVGEGSHTVRVQQVLIPA